MAPLHEPNQEDDIYVDVVPPIWGKLIVDYDHYDDGDEEEEEEEEERHNDCNKHSDSCSNPPCNNSNNNNNEEAKDTKKRIRFDHVVHIYVVEGKSHMTSEERRNTWYNKEEFAKLKDDAFETIAIMQKRQQQQQQNKNAPQKTSNDNNNNNNICTRGLEHFYQYHRTTKHHAKQIVLQEQQRQRLEFINNNNNIPPPSSCCCIDETTTTTLAALYKQESMEAVELALMYGRMDAKEAQMSNVEKARMFLALRRKASMSKIVKDVERLTSGIESQ